MKVTQPPITKMRLTREGARGGRPELQEHPTNGLGRITVRKALLN